MPPDQNSKQIWANLPLCKHWTKLTKGRPSSSLVSKISIFPSWQYYKAGSESKGLQPVWWPGVSVTKLFFFITHEEAEQTGVLVHAKPFQVSLIFVRIARAHPSGASFRVFLGLSRKYYTRLERLANWPLSYSACDWPASQPCVIFIAMPKERMKGAPCKY